MKHWDAPKGTRPEQRFWARTRLPVSDTTHDHCWLYMGPQTKEGYGTITVDSVSVLAHRFAYELLVGPVPEGMELDHVKARGCTHRNCVNPAHLEPVTQKENKLRGDSPTAKNARKTHCPSGHPYSAENTRVSPKGWRYCRTCLREQNRQYRERKRSAHSLDQSERLSG